jgi:hypothetical protein
VPPTTKEVTEAIKKSSRWGWLWGKFPDKPIPEKPPKETPKVEVKKVEVQLEEPLCEIDQVSNAISASILDNAQ